MTMIIKKIKNKDSWKITTFDGEESSCTFHTTKILHFLQIEAISKSKRTFKVIFGSFDAHVSEEVKAFLISMNLTHGKLLKCSKYTKIM